MPCAVQVGQRRYSGLVLNVSQGGLFIQTNADPGRGSEVDLELQPPGESYGIALSGTVAWRKLVPSRLRKVAGGGFGLRIHQADERYYRALARWMHPDGSGPAEGVRAPNPGSGPAEGVRAPNPGSGPAEGVRAPNPGSGPAEDVCARNPGEGPADGVRAPQDAAEVVRGANGGVEGVRVAGVLAQDAPLQPAWRVRVRAAESPRSRSLTVEAPDAEQARGIAMRHVGRDWEVLEVEPL